MDNSSLDWNDVAVFLAIVEAGSLSGAARRLGSSQPTIGRHLRQIEDKLGQPLFDRRARGLEPNEVARGLIPAAQAMQAAMQDFRLAAAGQDRGLAGTVRITASRIMSHYVLPPILARLRAEEPDIQVELVPSDATENLLYREADIAVRMYRATQLDVIIRHVGEISLGLFASRDYLARRGRPATMDDLAAHDFVGYDRGTQIIDGMRAQGFDVTRGDFPVRCDDQTTYWELVRAGCGIGFSQRHIARADPAVEEIGLDVGIPALPVWLAAAEATRHTPRVARVWDILAEELGRVVD